MTADMKMRRIDEETPREQWIVAGMKAPVTEDNPAGWWEATVMLHGRDSDDPNDNPLGSFASVLHYNGERLVGGFRGPLTHWRPLSSPTRTKNPRKEPHHDR